MEDFVPFTNRGYCHCCRRQVEFVAKLWWLRDHYLCSACGSIPRQRHLMHVLDAGFPAWEDLALHESSPSAVRENRYLEHWSGAYSFSQLLGGVEPGFQRDGVRCENLEALTFADESFDLVVTQDVLEHVFDPPAAVREIDRVLRPGGAHVFTAPKHKGLQRSRRRAASIDGVVEHLEEPMYHGSPVGDGRVLVTWDYGDDFEWLIGQWSGRAVTTYITRDRALGIDGEYLEVFVVRKPVELT